MKNLQLPSLTHAFLGLCAALPACQNKDTVKSEVAAPAAYAVGDTLTFGHYEQDGDATNGKEPIAWRVLDKNDKGQYLILSEKVLDAQPYNATRTASNWEKSTIRSWLNGYDASHNAVGNDYAGANFINAAFTAEEAAKIVASSVPADPNPKYSTPQGDATTDKIFLLSVVEANRYFPDDEGVRTEATSYAIQQGVHAYGSESGHSYAGWWLRTTCFDDAEGAALVSCKMIKRLAGSEKVKGECPDSFEVSPGGVVVESDVGVRPALWVQF